MTDIIQLFIQNDFCKTIIMIFSKTIPYAYIIRTFWVENYVYNYFLPNSLML